jgi:hypothetical protein
VSAINENEEKFEVFTAKKIQVVVFWVVMFTTPLRGATSQKTTI